MARLGWTRDAWQALIGALLVLLSATFVNAQGNDDDTGKRYIRCAAVFAIAAAVATDQNAKEGFSSASMLLLTWASELRPDRPAKDNLDQVTRDFGVEVVEVGREVKLKTPSAGMEFAAKFGGELNRCGVLIATEAKRRNAP